MSPVIRARLSETVNLIRDDGAKALVHRLIRRAYLRSGAAAAGFTLLEEDVSDSTAIHWAVPDRRPNRGTPLKVAWVTTPPRAGSGGHTTTLRLAQGVIDAGHQSTLYLYDRFGGKVDRHAAVLREHWPWMRADIKDARIGLGEADVYIATSWETAHALGARGSHPGRRMYLVQDLEHWFYGRGSEYALAEDSYRFGFTTITIGRMLATAMKKEFGVNSVVAEFGCDTDVYSLTNKGPRNGIVFYAKPDVPRRGYELGKLALKQFHARHPEQEIHIFGDKVGTLPFPAVVHGTVRPSELAALYNRSVAGLALSFTNVSLVPIEMLACGAIPVMNDEPYARPGLDNANAVWAHPSPAGLAEALSRVVEGAAHEVRAATAAASVIGGTWDDARRAVVAAIESEAYGP